MPRFVLQVRFWVNADSLDDARQKVEQVIEHGASVHGETEWDWVNRPRAETSKD